MMLLTYNALIAHGSSPKCAIVWGFLNEHELDNDRTSFKITNIANETTLSAFEIKTSVNTLSNLKAIKGLEIKNGTISFDSLDVKGLLRQVQKTKSIMLGEKSLPYMLLEAVTIEKTHIAVMSKMGLSLNACILFTVMNNYVHRQSLSNLNQSHTHWFEANYQLWIEMSGLTIKQVKEAKRGLVELGILETVCKGRPPVNHHRLNYEIFSKFIKLYFKDLENEQELFEAEAG